MAPGSFFENHWPCANGTIRSAEPCQIAVGTEISLRSNPHGPGERQVVVDPPVHTKSQGLVEIGNHVLTELVCQHGPVDLGQQGLERRDDHLDRRVLQVVAPFNEQRSQLVLPLQCGARTRSRSPVPSRRSTRGLQPHKGRPRLSPSTAAAAPEASGAGEGMRAATGPPSHQAMLST